MLKELTAVQFVRIMKGGYSFPYLINALDGDKLIPYVYKPFSIHYINQTNLVMKEFICSELARQFDLPTPNTAILILDDLFEQTINDSKAKKDFELKSKLPAFGSQIVESQSLGTNNIRSNFWRNYDVDMLFIFDMFILNIDRTARKPNLLVGDDSLILYDHEGTFEGINNANERQDQNLWEIYLIKNHLLYQVVKKKKRSGKLDFSSFIEYIRALNINEIDSFVFRLGELGHEIVEYTEIRKYILRIKQDSVTFVKTIQKMI